jgi:hypothetical protein
MKYTGEIEGQYGSREVPKKLALIREIPGNTRELVTLVILWVSRQSYGRQSPAWSTRSLLMMIFFPPSVGRIWNVLFFYYWWGRTKTLGTAATSGLLYKPQMIDEDDCGAIGGMKIGRGNRSTRRKPASAPLCPPQIPHDQTRGRTPVRRGGKPATNRLSYGAA